MYTFDLSPVEGIYTTIALHQRILYDADFVAGNVDTKYLQRPAFAGKK